MKTTQELVINALAPYGATLTGEFISKGDKVLSVKAVDKKGRLRFEGANGGLLMSGPIAAKTVESFVEKFWYWHKD